MHRPRRMKGFCQKQRNHGHMGGHSVKHLAAVRYEAGHGADHNIADSVFFFHHAMPPYPL